MSPQECGEYISLDGANTTILTGMYPLRKWLFLSGATDAALGRSRLPWVSNLDTSTGTLSLADKTSDEATWCSISDTAPVIALERLV